MLHIGSALPETVAFFSRYRCKLHFVDLFAELPALASGDDDPASLQQAFADLARLPKDIRFDLCLFWDLFNFLDRDAIVAMLNALRPHLLADTLAHGFAVHNLKTPQCGKIYGIREPDQITLRERRAPLPGYRPYNQGQLERVLDCFRITRSVLLPDSRLELLLHASITVD